MLVDTNVLLRSVQPSHSMHAVAVRAVKRLLARNDELAITIQNVAEFWNVATRPIAMNGLGFNVDQVRRQIARSEEDFRIIPETSLSYAHWKGLVAAHCVIGVKVHDARLVAVMKAHRIRQILTFNVADYARYPEIRSIHPEAIC